MQVKGLGQAAPLGTLDHLKRIRFIQHPDIHPDNILLKETRKISVWLCRKHPNGQPLELQIILCAKQPPAVSSGQAKANTSFQHASSSVTGAAPLLPSDAAHATPTAELQLATNAHTDTNMLCELPTSRQLVAASAPELMTGQSSMGVVSIDSRTRNTDTQQEQYIPCLPDNVAALVKQHQLKVQLAQVNSCNLFPFPSQFSTNQGMLTDDGFIQSMFLPCIAIYYLHPLSCLSASPFNLSLVQRQDKSSYSCWQKVLSPVDENA